MPDHPDSLAIEGKLVTSLNMSYYHIPVPFTAPQANHVREFCSLMKALEGSKVFVHCIMNYRVSAFMFHYLHKVQGYSIEVSKSPMFETWVMEPQWRGILDLSAGDIGL
jgi:protein tyrosine phosphatase (PTP) superfamily phosphohydrolase (DUF442 family)